MNIYNSQIQKIGTYIGKYRIQFLIAGGTFGKVYMSTHNTKKYAIKQLIQPIKNPQKQQMQNQIKVLADLNHENIVKLYQVIRQRNYIYLIMQYCQSDLKQLVGNKNGYFQQNQAYKILMQIVNGVNQLNKLHIVHRDIKPANILYHKGIFKVADFGLAKYVQDQYQMLMTRVGTPFYMAPQILKNQKYSSKCDIWSLGVIFYQLIFGILPWFATNQQQLIQAIHNVPLMFSRNVSYKTKKLLEKMIAVQEYQRFSWDQLIFQLNYSGIQNNYQLEKTFHRTTLQKLISLELDRISYASYGKDFINLKIEQRKSIIPTVTKFFTPQNKQICNYLIKTKLKL